MTQTTPPDVFFNEEYLRLRSCRRGVFAYNINDIIDELVNDIRRK